MASMRDLSPLHHEAEPQPDERFALGRVISQGDEVRVEPCYDGVDLSLEDYSRFKYGDGAVSRIYGSAMAYHLIPKYLEEHGDQDIYVTSSAFKVAQPASTTLLEPFIGMARAVTHAMGAASRIIPFKIDRANLTDGDYADMSLEERKKVINGNGLTIPKSIDISDTAVIALDDIRVTGSHEVSLDGVLNQNGASRVTHAYILNVVDGKSDPTLEARINGFAVGDITDLIAIASLKHFAVNARFGKRILSDSEENIRHFSSTISTRILSRIINDAIGDGLDQMSGYADGFMTLVDAFASRVKPQVK